MAYRVYYGNGAIHSSDDGTPPARGVQVIVQTHPDVGLHTQSGYDFYLRRDSRWVGVDRAGLFADMEDRGVARFNIGIHHYVMMNGEWVEVDEFGLYRFIEETGYALFG